MSNPLNPADFFSDKQIQGKSYTVVALNTWDAWDGWTLILKTIAPVFGEVLDSRNVDEAMMFEKQHTFKEILALVARDIHQPEMRVLVAQMLNGATCNGEVINMDTHFGNGKVHEMLEVVIYALEVNFKGFFTQNDMFQSFIKGMSTVMGGIDQGLTEE